MISKDNTSLQDEMNLALVPLGLQGWEAMWEPDSSQKINGRVLTEQKIIIVFTEDPERAKDVFLHEAIEVKIQPLITQYQETINGLIKIIGRLTYLDKERMINTMVPLIRYVFEDKK